MNTRLYLVRHGENQANLTKEFSHRKVDYPLTPKGRLQAAQTAAFFAGKQVDAIYASPLRRALETAELISEQVGLPVTVIEEFREVNVGTLEDTPPTPDNWKLHDEIIAAWNAGQHEVAFPGGEDYHTLRARLHQALATIASAHPGQTVIVVAHGGTIGTSVREFCSDADLELLRTTANHNCSVSEIEIWSTDSGVDARLIGWALCEHLQGEAAQLVPGSPDAAFFEATDEH